MTQLYAHVAADSVVVALAVALVFALMLAHSEYRIRKETEAERDEAISARELAQETLDTHLPFAEGDRRAANEYRVGAHTSEMERF